MDLQELNQDRKIASAANKVDKIIDRGFSDKARSIVNQSAWIGAIALAFPLFGLDNILYGIVLWGMYVRICSLAKQSFGQNMTKSFIGGFIVNLLVSGLLELLLSPFPGLNFVGAFVVGFLSIKISGAAYLKALEILHNGNVSEKYDFNKVTD